MDPLSAAIGSVGGVVSGIASIFNTKSTNKANARENERNRQFNHDEAELSRQFNHDEAVLNRDWQEKMTQQEREWNSYENQVKLMKQAGINPYNALSGLSGSAVSSGSSLSGGAASSSPASSGASHGMQSPDLSSIASLGLTMSQADLNRAQAKNIDEQTLGQSLQNTMQQMQNDVYKDLGRISAEIDLNAKDAKRAVDDSTRYLINTQAKLANFDLLNQKPADLVKTLVDTIVSSNEAELKKALTSKTEQDKELGVKQFYLSCYLASAAYLKDMAEANYTNSQNSVFKEQWKPFAGAQWYTSYYHSKQAAFKTSVYDELGPTLVGAIDTSLRSNSLYNQKITDAIRGIGNRFFNLQKALGLSSGPMPLTLPAF